MQVVKIKQLDSEVVTVDINANVNSYLRISETEWYLVHLAAPSFAERLETSYQAFKALPGVKNET